MGTYLSSTSDPSDSISHGNIFTIYTRFTRFDTYGNIFIIYFRLNISWEHIYVQTERIAIIQVRGSSSTPDSQDSTPMGTYLSSTSDPSDSTSHGNIFMIYFRSIRFDTYGNIFIIYIRFIRFDISWVHIYHLHQIHQIWQLREHIYHVKTERIAIIKVSGSEYFDRIRKWCFVKGRILIVFFSEDRIRIKFETHLVRQCNSVYILAYNSRR